MGNSGIGDGPRAFGQLAVRDSEDGMGSFQDAMKKAGLSSAEAEAAAENSEKPAEKQESRAEGRPEGDRKPRGPKPPPAKLEEKPCAKCGTTFLPKHAKHRLCPKCA